MARKFHPEKMRGPALPEEKALRGYFDTLGMPEGKMPIQLRDFVVAKTKKGPIGSLVVRNMTGLENNTAMEITRKFEQNVGGKEEVAEKLASLPDLPEETKALVAIIRDGSKKSLARIAAECGVEPTSLMRQYARGCVELGVVNAAIEAHRDLPRLVKDLMYNHALDKMGACGTCAGSGMVKKNPNYKKDTLKCPQCEGSGKGLTSSPHKQFAARTILEMTKQIGGKEGVTVNVQQNVATFGGGGSFMEKTLLANEEILNPARARAVDIVEAEIVQSEDR